MGTFRLCGFYSLIVLLALAVPGQAQNKFASDLWHNGKLVTENGDTLRGQIKYSFQDDLMQIQANGRLETYTPRKALFTEIFDQQSKRFRQFYSLPYATTGQYKAPVFFELMEEGKLTLLCRETIEYRTMSSSYYYGAASRLVLITHYFFLRDDGTITPFSGKKNDLYELMGTRGEGVRKYARQNKLNFDYKYGLGAIVHYYNSLVK